MELHLISILANAGDVGLYEEHIKQLDMEIEALERLDRLENTIPVHSFIPEDVVENRTNKLATFKSRLNKKLKPINLMIYVRKMDGHWYLGDINGHSKAVKLEKTIWDAHENTYPKRYKPKKLSKQQSLVWQCLWEQAPAFVNWQKIASVLIKKDNSEYSPEIKQVSDAIHNLQGKIRETDYIILRDNEGNYRVCRKQASVKTATENE
jgi:hypothetical protein